MPPDATAREGGGGGVCTRGRSRMMTARGRAAVVFDFDGTLVESTRGLLEATNRLLVEERRQALTLSQMRPMLGGGAPRLVEHAFRFTGAPPVDLGAAVERWRAHYDGCALRVHRAVSRYPFGARGVGFPRTGSRHLHEQAGGLDSEAPARAGHPTLLRLGAGPGQHSHTEAAPRSPACGSRGARRRAGARGHGGRLASKT